MPIRQETRGRVLIVTLDDPDVRNAFDAERIDELRTIFESLAYREVLPPDARPPYEIATGERWRPHAVVLRAEGDVFCAGAHLGMMRELGQADYQQNVSAALAMGAMFRAIRDCPVPVVGRIQGAAYGGGVGLVAACDVVVCAPQARFVFSEVRLGLVPGVISPLVVERLGPAQARRVFLTGEKIDAAEARRLGLVDHVTPDGELDETVDAQLDLLLAGGPQALGMCKALVQGVASLGYTRSAELSARMIAEARQTPEAQAALAAFAQKKPAPWNDTNEG